ncbi:hypothetical protein EB796_017438 [Bugula neritina]|uniref:Uncharacterized protein n=1 Tax=Bugula neritina TaxID=10212 RepID=A0A7J7JF82_BUGNE|nr:hypothetical protein EB796_017438 [Bugula neritina]
MVTTINRKSYTVERLRHSMSQCLLDCSSYYPQVKGSSQLVGRIARFCIMIWIREYDKLIVLLVITAGVKIQSSYASQQVQACLLGEDPKQGEIACPDSDTRISIERVQTAYASDSCDNSTCPFSISSSHVYYKHINATCGNRASCTIDAQQLADNFSNSFRYCNSGGNSRNVVTILFSCISGFSMPALIVTTESTSTNLELSQKTTTRAPVTKLPPVISLVETTNQTETPVTTSSSRKNIFQPNTTTSLTERLTGIFGESDKAKHENESEMTMKSTNKERNESLNSGTNVLGFQTTFSSNQVNDESIASTLSNADQPINKDNGRLMVMIVISVMSVLIVTIISLILALCFVKKRGKQRNIQLTKTKPIGTLASSDAYDIIDDGTLNGSRMDVYYTSPHLSTPAGYYIEATSPISKTSLQSGGSYSNSGDTGEYYEAVDAENANYDIPVNGYSSNLANVYAKVRKTPKTDGASMLVVNDLYEPMPTFNRDIPMHTYSNDNQTIIIENDLYNHWT